MATVQEQLKLIADLRDYDHVFLSEEGVLHFTRPFGFDGKSKVTTASPDGPKGLTLANGASQARGAAAEKIAAQICEHLKVEYPSMMGRGFMLRACCDVIERHLKSIA